MTIRLPLLETVALTNVRPDGRKSSTRTPPALPAATPLLTVRVYVVFVPCGTPVPFCADSEVLVTVSAGIAGPIAMWARQGEGDAFLGNGIDLSSRALPDSWPVAIVEYANGVVLTANTLTEATDLLYPMVQRFPDGNLLVVNARCRWRASGPDLNARVIAPDGTTIGRGCLGDGIDMPDRCLFE